MNVIDDEKKRIQKLLWEACVHAKLYYEIPDEDLIKLMVLREGYISVNEEINKELHVPGSFRRCFDQNEASLNSLSTESEKYLKGVMELFDFNFEE